MCFRCRIGRRFQSSSGQKAGCNIRAACGIQSNDGVSILIRPEGRMQCVARLPEAPSNVFQSSSGQKAGCNVSTVPPSHAFCNCFNPHPARRPDAIFNDVSQNRSPSCFNPHPARRPDAIADHNLNRVALQVGFQSSSGQKAGCNSSMCSQDCLRPCFNPHPARRPDAMSAR